MSENIPIFQVFGSMSFERLRQIACKFRSINIWTEFLSGSDVIVCQLLAYSYEGDLFNLSNLFENESNNRTFSFFLFYSDHLKTKQKTGLDKVNINSGNLFFDPTVAVKSNRVVS